MASTPNHKDELKRDFHKYKYCMIVIMALIYGLFAFLMMLSLDEGSLHDEIIKVRFGLITLSTLLFIIVFKVMALKAREYEN